MPQNSNVRTHACSGTGTHELAAQTALGHVRDLRGRRAEVLRAHRLSSSADPWLSVDALPHHRPRTLYASVSRYPHNCLYLERG